MAPLAATSLSVPWFVWCFWGAVGVGMLLAWLGLGRRLVRAIPRRRQSLRVARYAALNGWRYTRRDWLRIESGVPFGIGDTTPCTNIVVGSVDGVPFTAFEYDHALQAFVIDLAANLPFLEVRSRTMADTVNPEHTPIRLESDEFNERYRVVALDPHYAAAVLHPLLMARLLSGPDLSWRLLRGDLVGWHSGTLDPARIVPTVLTLRSIRDAIPRYVWDDYATPSSR